MNIFEKLSSPKDKGPYVPNRDVIRLFRNDQRGRKATFFLYKIDWIKLFVFNTKINADKEKKETISNQKYHSVLVVLDYLI